MANREMASADICASFYFNTYSLERVPENTIKKKVKISKKFLSKGLSLSCIFHLTKRKEKREDKKGGKERKKRVERRKRGGRKKTGRKRGREEEREREG